jgi:HEAT repeat protein
MAKQIAAALLWAMLRDPSVHVRAEAVRSLAHVGPLAGIDPGPIKEAVENDPATEVRTAAMGALFTGWPEHSRNKDVLGR